MKLLKIMFVTALLILTIAIILLVATDIRFEIFNRIKPITLVQYSGFFAFALFLEIIKPYFNPNKDALNLLIMIAFLLILAALFEMLWSFGYWFSTYELKVMSGLEENSATLDKVYYVPSPELREYYFYQNMSLNHSAKKNTLFFMMSVYLLYYLKKNYAR